MLGFLVNLILTSLVFYNIHHSFKNTTKDWKKFYRHYFVVVSILLAIDNLFGFILYRIPYYQILKLMILGWISIPNGTGPHFFYNVYIKNIHRLFQGDIDAIFESVKKHFESFKAKYNDMVKNKKIKTDFGFRSNTLEAIEKVNVESSDFDASTHVADDNEEVVEEIKNQ